MPFKRKRSDLVLTDEERKKLEGMVRSRNATHGRVVRAGILLAYAESRPIHAISKEVGVSRPTVERCVDKALSGGVELALCDLPRSGRPASISREDKAWVINLACKKPVELGYANEVWTYSLLRDHIRRHASKEGYSALSRVTKSIVHEILAQAEIKPHKVNYYLERRDVDFDAKMAQVLMVYKEVSIINDLEASRESQRTWAVVSYDEKPGIQAIANTAPDLPPVPAKHSTMGRDYEYRRCGTLSLLAGIDLHDGRVIGLVRDRHRSKEFTEFLQVLDESYPPTWKLRIILDNHSAHISKETMTWLKGHPNRFEFIFTPKHGSWLNLVETFFSKMTRSFLRYVRVQSKQELKRRIEQYLNQVNEDPVVFRWTYRLDEVHI